MDFDDSGVDDDEDEDEGEDVDILLLDGDDDRIDAALASSYNYGEGQDDDDNIDIGDEDYELVDNAGSVSDDDDEDEDEEAAIEWISSPHRSSSHTQQQRPLQTGPHVVSVPKTASATKVKKQGSGVSKKRTTKKNKDIVPETIAVVVSAKPKKTQAGTNKTTGTGVTDSTTKTKPKKKRGTSGSRERDSESKSSSRGSSSVGGKGKSRVSGSGPQSGRTVTLSASRSGGGGLDRSPSQSSLSLSSGTGKNSRSYIPSDSLLHPVAQSISRSLQSLLLTNNSISVRSPVREAGANNGGKVAKKNKKTQDAKPLKMPVSASQLGDIVDPVRTGISTKSKPMSPTSSSLRHSLPADLSNLSMNEQTLSILRTAISNTVEGQTADVKAKSSKKKIKKSSKEKS
jgi:hypothetical protein